MLGKRNCNNIFNKTHAQNLLLAIVFLTLLPCAYADVEDPLTLGIFPRRNAIDTNLMYMPLVKYLSHKINRDVKLLTFKDFPTFWKQIHTKRFDITHFNQYHYVKAHKELGYEAIVVNEEFGESTITGSIIVRKDSNINSVQDLKGKHIVFGGGLMAMQSYIYASYLLMQHGLNKGDYTFTTARTPPNAILATFYKQAAAGGVGDKVLKLRSVTSIIDTDQLRFLVKGKQYPHLPWAVRSEMPAALKQQITELLIGLKDTPTGQRILNKGNLTGFARAHDEDFDPHRKIIYKVLDKQY